jgi:pimeloyl-ACP methyl ester carboxylesterase
MVPTVVISGDVDKTVSTNIHSRPFANAVREAKLIVLPGVGHMIPNVAPELVISEIEKMIRMIGPSIDAAAKQRRAKRS